MPTATSSSPSRDLLDRVLTELGAPWSTRTELLTPPHPVPLPSRLATGDLAWASVAAVCAAAGTRPDLDPDRVALAYRSDRLLTIDGAPPAVWSPYSGFWRTRDGWVRTHGNYAHHARGLLRALEASDAAQVRDALAERSRSEAVDAITAAGGLAVTVTPEDPEHDESLRRTPLLDIRRSESPAARRRGEPRPDALPLTGIRVLDLTRVIAGPVCTRTLALLGADVLRIDPPKLPEPVWQHDDTGHGKRTALLDASSTAMHDLLAEADVVVLGYRPAALERLGLSPDDLAARHPHLVIAQLSAWGADQPDRAGFDSLVQAESGIALIESADGEGAAISDEDEFLLSLNRFNVMASRARAKLIVLVSRQVVDHLSADPEVLRGSALLKTYVETFCSNNRPMTLGFNAPAGLRQVTGEFRWR